MITLKPILLDIPDYPVWEYEFSIPDDVVGELLVDENWLLEANTNLKHPSNRMYMRPEPLACQRFLIDTLRDIQKEMMVQVFDPDGPFKHSIRGYWPEGVCLKNSSQIIKDLPNFEMGKHIDNRNSFAASILNLTDNESSTDLFYQGNLIYSGPKKQGTGILILNTDLSYHSISNSRTRYIALMNLALDMAGTRYWV